MERTAADGNEKTAKESWLHFQELNNYLAIKKWVSYAEIGQVGMFLLLSSYISYLLPVC